jgi:hypothetical protein
MNEYFTKDGRSFTIQNPTADHAEGIINCSKALFASTD